MAPEGDRDAVLRGLGIKRRSKPEDASSSSDSSESSDEAAGGEDLDPLGDMAGSMVAAPTEAPEKPERDVSLGIRRRSGPTAQPAAGGQPAARGADGNPKRAEKADKNAAPEPAPKLGNEPADQLLATIMKQVEGAAAWAKGKKYVKPFPDEFLTYRKSHGWYHGDGRAERKVKLGLKPAGVVFAVPTLFQFEHEKIPQPIMHDDGFEVSAELNKLGNPYHYVVFILPEGATRPEPKDSRGKANRESGRIAGLGIKRRSV